MKLMNPAAKDLRNRIEDFIGEYGYEPDNRLLIYFSGHGYTQVKGTRQFGYLVPSDAQDPKYDEKGFFKRPVKMTQIQAWAKQIESKHAIFLFDSCFSGTVLKSRGVSSVIPEDITYLTDKPVRQFISAGSADQKVPAQSVFRPLFIRGINGKADLDRDGYVTGTELGMYLQKQVPRYETGQTPQYDKIRDPLLDEGNFVFVIPKPTPKSTKKTTKRPPKAPSSSDFSLSDLESEADKDETTRKAWRQQLQKMQKAVKQVRRYVDRDVPAKKKAEAWERFLSVFAQDNPYSSVGYPPGCSASRSLPSFPPGFVRG